MCIKIDPYYQWQKDRPESKDFSDVHILPNANDTHTRNQYRKLVPENPYQFSGTSFSYQMKLEAKFLVPETNMADENIEADAQNNTLQRNITPTNTGNHPHAQM